MPAGSRIRANNSFGVTTDNPLTAGAVTFNSAGLATLPVVSSAHAVVVLDPKRVFGEPEIVVVTVHTAAATVATIIRGQYGTVARSHPQGTVWGHVPIDEDFIEVLTSATRPSNPYASQLIFQTDTDSFFARNAANTAWANINMYADPPSCRITRAASKTITTGTDTAIDFDQERYDTSTMHDNVVQNTRITIPVAGLYDVGGGIRWQASATGIRQVAIRVNGSTVIANILADIDSVIQQQQIITTQWKFAAGDFMELLVHHTNGADLAVEKAASYSPEFWATWIGRG